MKPPSLLHILLLLAVVCATTLSADPADELRDLDRLLKEGRISKAEYDRRWSEVVSAGTRRTSVPRLEQPPVKPRPPERVRNELSLSGGVAALEDIDINESLVGGTALLGRFVTPHLQLSAGLSYGTGEIDDIEYDIFGALGVADYHVNIADQFFTYIGAGAGYARLEREEDYQNDWFWTAHIGIKQYVAPDTALKYQIGYIDYDDIGLSGVTLSFGICLLF